MPFQVLLFFHFSLRFLLVSPGCFHAFKPVRYLMAFCFCLPASVSSSCSHICYFLRISCSMKIISFSLLNSYKQILTKHAQNFSIYKILIKLQARFFCQCYNCIIFMCNFCILLQLLFWISFFRTFF